MAIGSQLWLGLAVFSGALGGEFQVAPDPVAGPQAAKSQWSSVCFGDAGYGFAAWEDGRCGTTPCVVGTLIDAAGVHLFPTGLLLSQEGERPSVACGTAADPTTFLAVWESATDDIWGNLIFRDGGVTPPFAIFKGAGSHYDAHLATDGQRYLVAWADTLTATNRSIYTAFVTADGGVSNVQSLASLGALVPSRVRVAWNGSEYLVGWLQFSGAGFPALQLLRVDANGVAQGSAVGLGPEAVSFDLVWNGSWWVVVREESDGDLFSTWVDAALQVQSLSLQLNVTASRASRPAMALTPQGVAVFWGESTGTLRARELVVPSDAGALLTVLPTDEGREPAVAFGPSGFVLTTTLTDQIDTSVRTVSVSPTFTVQGPLKLVQTPAQRTPDLAAIGDVYLVTWVESTPAGRSIKAIRLRPDGSRLDAAPLTLAAGAAGSEFHDPQIAVLGNEWLVVWFEAGNETAQGRKVKLNGTLSPAAPVTLSPVGEIADWPVVGSDGQNYLVGWQRTSTNMRAQLINSDLVPVGAAFDVATTGLIDPDPLPWSIAGNDAGFVFTWHEANSVRASRISPSGSVIDFNGVSMFTDTLMTQPSVAFDGQRFRVAASRDGLVETTLSGGASTTPGGLPVMGSAGVEVKGARLAPITGGLQAIGVKVVSVPNALRQHRVAVASTAADGGWNSPRQLSEGSMQRSFARAATGATTRMYVWAEHNASANGPRIYGRGETLQFSDEVCAADADCISGACVTLRCLGGPPRPIPDAGGTGGGSGGSGGSAGSGGSGGVGGAGGGGDPLSLRVGCGCSSGASLGAVALLALGLRRRRRR